MRPAHSSQVRDGHGKPHLYQAGGLWWLVSHGPCRGAYPRMVLCHRTVREVCRSAEPFMAGWAELDRMESWWRRRA